MPRKEALRGTTEYIGKIGIQEYNFSERPIKSSGLANRVWINTRNNPIRMGIWTTIGPKQPMGLTPASLYSFMVSWEARDRSPLYLA
jgi:hypothetical protein